MNPYKESQTLAALTKHERSTLVYAESCEVDRGGLMEGKRLNNDDMINLRRFQKAGLLEAGRVAWKDIQDGDSHWVRLTDAGWALAHEARRARAQQKGPRASLVFERLAAKKAEEEPSVLKGTDRTTSGVIGQP